MSQILFDEFSYIKSHLKWLFYGEWLVYQALLLFTLTLPMVVLSGKMEFNDNS